ncbi:MAG: RNA polymerase sigma factor [Verrucomicrobia bacterium]|nr:RNA polymerase sigma factor [Verrucomicrobiota bacterium]
MSQPITEPALSTPPGVAPPPDHSRWFEDEVHAHDRQLKCYLRGSFPSVRDVDDVVQESYLRVWKRHAMRPIVSAKSFLFTVARHLALDVLRHERRSPIDSVGDLAALGVLDNGATVHEIVSKHEKVELLIAAIDALPARCREVVILHKLKLLPVREVAAKLGISEKGVEIQLKRGLVRVRECLRRRGIGSLLGPES